MLRGRRAERAALDGLLDAVRIGQSGTLVLRGEPGIGKTAILEYGAERATGCRVASAAGVQSEMELAFAGLHQLCAPLLDGLQRLPLPQQTALQTAFGLESGARIDRFFVGLAVLGLLSDSAERPLVCLIDDAQWLDQASVQSLGFAARRLGRESVMLVFATRATSEPDELAGLPEVWVGGLGEADARELLSSAIPAPLDERVRDRIVAETRGNPLALLELPKAYTVAELAGGFALPATLPLPGKIEQSYLRRVEQLPAQAQRLLLLAAAEPVGDPALLRRAAARLDIDLRDVSDATDGLLTSDSRVRFCHPLVRSAVYRGATPAGRREVHEALAAATEPDHDPDRRAWHQAHATSVPDEAVAAELERSATRAQARGGLAAAAAFLERATELSPDPSSRTRRAIDAAQAKYLAGAPDAAFALLAAAEAGPLDELLHARVDLLRAQIAFGSNRGSDAPPLLLAAAKRFESLDAQLARETYLDALLAAMFAGRLASGGGLLEVAQAIRAAPPAAQPPRATDLLLDGLAVRISVGYVAGAPLLQEALRALRSERMPTEASIRWLWLGCHTADDLWDDETFEDLSARNLQLARSSGVLAELPLALLARLYFHLIAGELGVARSLIEELASVLELTGSQLAPYGALELAALHGREPEASALIGARRNEVEARGEGLGLTLIQNATALLGNGLGRYSEAFVAAREASEHPEELGTSTWTLPELIEAAVRSGRTDVAADALQRLSETTRATGTDWALGIESRSRALLLDGPAAERLYREAIERLGRTRIRLELARAHLLYGEWLRRASRRIDARVQLRTAHELFVTMGTEAFAERAARELLATGETVRKRIFEATAELTEQEAQIARLARDGLSNPEIGARLFLSPRTVEWHLRKVFTKLGIGSRRELRRVLPAMDRQTQIV